MGSSPTRVMEQTSTKMAFIPVALGFQGGIDQSALPTRANLGKFYNLINFRHNTTQFGKLEQTPWFTQSVQFNQGTYWNGSASTTEITGSSVVMHTGQVVATNFVYEDSGGTQIVAYEQSTQPTAVNVNTGCRVVVNSVTGLALALGDTLDIVIDGAATFKWRKSGGAYTLAVPITTTGVSIDGGNATVYFLTATGFNVNDTWKWTRTDCSFDMGTTRHVNPTEFTLYKNVIYLVNRNSRICRVTVDNSNVKYAITLGYRAVYGNYLTFYDDHLVIGGYSATSGTDTAMVRTMGWSDKTDIDNFIATDVNEADVYVLPNLAQTEVIPTTTPLCVIMGVSVVAERLFVFTSREVYVTSALGLPNVFSFTLFARLHIVTAYSPVITAPNGVYIVGNGDIYFFDGAEFKSIGLPIVNATNLGIAFGKWNPYTRELLVSTLGYIFVWQERWNSWYCRGASFSANTPAVGCFCYFDSTSVYLGISNRRVITDFQSELTQPVFDATSGAAYTTPTITTQSISGNRLSIKKEASGTYCGLSTYSTGVSATYYSTAANLQVALYWYKDDIGQITGSPATVTGASWISTNSDGTFSYPRIDFRALALELQLVGLVNGKPPYRIYVTGIELSVKNLEPAVKVDR